MSVAVCADNAEKQTARHDLSGVIGDLADLPVQ